MDEITVSQQSIFALLMIVLGIVSLALRRQLVRWHRNLFWKDRTLPPEVTRRREILQLAVGIFLLGLGVAFLFLRW
jgi:hypothetical protein